VKSPAALDPKGALTLAQAVPQPERSRWSMIADAIRGRERAHAAESAYDVTTSFAEVVWAHSERQHEIEQGIVDGPWEKQYRRRLKRFKDEHGDIVDSYWCRYEASGVALTMKREPRSMLNFLRVDPILKLHAATDWRTESAPAIGSSVHRWEATAIKATEILRGTSEKIALHRIFAAVTRLLAYVDREPDTKAFPGATLEDVLKEQKAERAEVEDYYQRAGENSARIVYFRGMIWGTVALAAVVGGGFLLTWWIGWLDPDDTATYTLFVTVAMGAGGAILSVMTRMARRDGFNLEFEVGRKSMRYLGALRPWIGAMFALAVYVAFKSKLVDLLPDVPHDIYFYATVGFLSGFSERRAKVLLDSTGVGSDAEPATAPK
jgi:hypothetical protein